MKMRDAYRNSIENGDVKSDAGQARVAGALARLGDELERLPAKGGFRWPVLGKAAAMPKGLYIHGDVGRGKTMLMDMFFAGVHVAPKRRIHFHGFMQEVHGRLHAARKQERDAIAPVAKAIAGEARLLCLDEMQINDIADAMIVGRLFEAMNATLEVSRSTRHER